MYHKANPPENGPDRWQAEAGHVNNNIVPEVSGWARGMRQRLACHATGSGILTMDLRHAAEAAYAHGDYYRAERLLNEYARRMEWVFGGGAE